MKTIDPKPVIALLQKLLTEMVEHPENLVIEHRALTASVTITIQAHAGDTPRLIGEGAGNYRAIVAIATAAGARRGFRVNIPPIKEPVVGEPSRYRFTPTPDWPRKRILGLLRDTLGAVFAHPEKVVCNEDDDDANHITTVEAFVSRMERAEVLDALAPAIRRVFDAIGKAHGRLLAVDVVQSADPEQPDSADGRHMKQLKR